MSETNQVYLPEKLWGLMLVALLILAGCSGRALEPSTGDVESDESAATTNESNESTADSPEVDVSKYAELDIVTLLPRDAIPAIDDPQFLSAAEADDFYDPDELVIGVAFNEDARAYSVSHLSSHEIVNDTVGGVKISVTW